MDYQSYQAQVTFYSFVLVLSYLSIIFLNRDKHINEKCGKDAIYYLVFQRYLIVYIIFVTVVSLAVILPINLYGKACNYTSPSLSLFESLIYFM